MKHLKSNGFTLIEVLIASVILFTSISAISLVYRGAYLSSEKANTHIKLTSVLPSILVNVQDDIRARTNLSDNDLNDTGFAWDIEYEWHAKLLAFESAPTKFDVDSGNFVASPKKYKLWDINLTLKSDNQTKTYNYQEISWTND